MSNCINCQQETPNPRFCSRSCSATFNNLAKPKKGITSCRFCNIQIQKTKNNSGFYCSNKCQLQYQNKISIGKWISREKPGHTGKTYQLSPIIRNYLKETRGSACESCGWDGHHPDDNASLTEIDHIDGDASNSFIENLRILCPNCHSMTSTFRNRNKNSVRVRNTK
jgi:hypothetical protein